MSEHEAAKFGWVDAVELAALVGVGVGSWLKWGAGDAILIPCAVVLAVCLLPKMIRNARGGDKRGAD